MHLLDTNILIYYFKGLGRVAEHLLATPPKEIAISTITLYELEVGIEKSPAARERRRSLAEFEAVVQVFAFGRAEARSASKIRAELEAAGQPIGPLDNLIAGTALAHGATLITHNVDEFRRVRGLQVVDWY